MKTAALLAAICASTVLAETEQVKPRAALFTIETAPGQTVQITEDERWEMTASGGCGSHFFDITEFNAEPREVVLVTPYPTQFKQEAKLKALFPKLSWENIKKNLEQYAKYHTRFQESDTGVEASEWLLKQIQDVVAKSQKKGITAKAFEHTQFPQNSIIVTIPGRSNRTVVVGAHLDSINQANRQGRAPGVDDNASGSFLLLESLRVLLSDKDFGTDKLQNTVEFHWYAAEEGGLRGSQDIFTQYAESKRDIWAMLNQDMVGYTKATIDAGKPEHFGRIVDNTNAELNEYVGKVIEKYTDIPFVDSKCGYACSDHGSAMRNGFPASFIFEAAFEYRNPYIHTDKDTIEHLDPKHVLQHGRLVLSFLYELGFTRANDRF